MCNLELGSGDHCKPEQLNTAGQKTGTSYSSNNQQRYKKERYLPLNTKTIIDAAIHPNLGLCCMLAIPVEHYSTERYVLSMIALPSIPPGANKLTRNDQEALRPDQHTLKWQKHLSSNSWQLFSSSEVHPIVSFNSQGTHVIFGSVERWGILDVQSGGQLWSLPSPNRRSSLPTLGTRLLNEDSSTATTPSDNKINAYLIHHEFLFILQQDAKMMRIYDLTDTTTSHEPLAEGELPWSYTKSSKYKWAQGLVRLHHTHQKHRQLLRDEYQLVFCAGRIWITGMYNSDLLCSSPFRLLRRLRSRLKASEKDVLPLQFCRMKTDLMFGVPHTMYTWNETHLYVIDGDCLHCWRKPDSNDNGKPDSNGVGCRITKLLSFDNSFIEDVHIDSTKVIVSTNCTYRNTTTRDWDGSGSIWVIPIDVFDLIDSSSSTKQGNNIHTKAGLVKNQPYSPSLQLYHKRLFNVQNFASTVGTDIRQRSPLRGRYPISNSSNSNYQVVGIMSDGRYVLVRCKKGASSKTAILDLYGQAA